MKMRGRCRRHQLPLAVACMLLVVLPLRPSVAQEMQMSLSPRNLAKTNSAAEGGGQQGQDGGEGGAAAGFSPTPAASPSFETYQHYFALCTVTKDTPGDLREWVDYHHGLGVTKFYIFDTDQRVPNGPILQDYIEDGTVEYYHLPRVTPRTIPIMQVRLYYLCLKHVSSKHQFMGFWDVDEFLVLPDPTTRFPDLLRRYENFGGVVVNWRLMGSSGHLTRPPGGVLRNFIKCTPEEYHENHQIKTIVNTQWVYLPTTDPHHFAYKENKYAVSTDCEKVEGPVNPAIRDSKMVLFHYALKSTAEYKEKMRKGSAMGNYKNMLFFQRINDAATENCTQAVDACRRWGLTWCTGEPGSRGELETVAGRVLPWRKDEAKTEQQQQQQQEEEGAGEKGGEKGGGGRHQQEPALRQQVQLPRERGAQEADTEGMQQAQQAAQQALQPQEALAEQQGAPQQGQAQGQAQGAVPLPIGIPLPGGPTAMQQQQQQPGGAALARQGAGSLLPGTGAGQRQQQQQPTGVPVPVLRQAVVIPQASGGSGAAGGLGAQQVQQPGAASLPRQLVDIPLPGVQTQRVVPTQIAGELPQLPGREQQGLLLQRQVADIPLPGAGQQQQGQQQGQQQQQGGLAAS